VTVARPLRVATAARTFESDMTEGWALGWPPREHVIVRGPTWDAFGCPTVISKSVCARTISL